MTSRATTKGKNKKPLETTLGKAPLPSGNDPIDLSHIRKPIDTSIFGLRQVFQLFETATEEVRRYVAYECDIMYECRMCRTIFRSFANFILHKRNYCRESYNRNDHTNCRNNCQENEFYVTEEEADPLLVTVAKEQNSGTNSPVLEKCNSKETDCLQPTNDCANLEEMKENKKNLNYVLRRLKGRQESTRITEQCLSEDVSNESKSSDKEEAKNNVALQKIAGSTSGVFQSMFCNMIEEYKGDLMKTEVMEIHNILENNEAILGSDGKIVSSESEKSANFMCTVCNQNFSTKKTLTYHIKYKHNNTRLVYQCPECNDTFANAWSVFRHLYKIHRKTTAQVKRLRNQIHANIIRRDQTLEPKDTNTVKTNSEVISDLREKVDIENQQWMDDLEGDNDLQRCGGCGRKFERKAALHSHSQFCSKRIAICNSIKENSAKRVQAEEKQSDKTKHSKTNSTTNAENATKGSRRRKQLISQKMCRVDYVKDEVKDNEEVVEKPNEDFKPDQDNRDKTDKHKKYWKETVENDGDLIEVHDENNESDNEELVRVQDSDEDEGGNKIIEDLKPNFATVFIVEEPRPPSRSESRSSDSDDVIYVDTVRLLPTNGAVPDLVDPVNDVNQNLEAKVTPTIIKNSIITRSKKNATLMSDDKHSVELDDEANVAEENSKIFNENFANITVQSREAAVPIKIVSVESLKSQNNNETNSETTSFKKTEHIECADNNKRKRIESARDPQPANSKRKKGEITPDSVLPENSVTKFPKITLQIKSLKYIDKQNHVCLPCKRTFKSHKSLMKHMAIHFNWYRYQCCRCSFMSYGKSKCDRHAEVQHGIGDEETLKNTVIHIPSWKIIDKSTDFVECCKKHKAKDVELKGEQLSVDTSGKSLSELHEEDEIEEKSGEVQKGVNLTPSSNTNELLKTEDSELQEVEALKDETSVCKPDVQDPSVRKMIMEVIFGNQDESSSQEEKEPEVVLVNHGEKRVSKCSEAKLKSVDVDNLIKTEDTVEDFLGFRNSAEEEDQFQVHNPSLSSVISRENPRPVRNRVPTVQKDFLYDMTQILKPKGTKDREINTAGLHKEVDFVKRSKPIRTYSRSKKPTQLTITNGKHTVNKSVQHVVVEPHANLVQDINMNSKDLETKHVTGQC